MAESERTQRRSSKKLRCAIYTRKSTDEGLEQAFNSLDAQREACMAFIQSQKHEGWVASPTLYDDGGFSGGTLERPSLKRLLADIEAGQVNVIVVYKVDRLTRALSDFAKLVEIFDRRGVSFVSITQQFNTTTSMGRLTLNVLLSFAQFEREVIGERVRDKIAASKKKGMWMGGMPPLGYDVKDRKLVVNAEEARRVVSIYRRYLELKSVHVLKDELAEADIRSKRRDRPDGTTYGSQLFSRGALYLMLQNRIYRGETTHKGNSYPGEHPAIIEQPLWDEVQAVLAKNRVERATGVRAKHPSLLAGLVYDEKGERLTPTHAVKKGTRYRYYVSTGLLTGAKKDHSSARRIPAGDVERLVIDRLRAFFADPTAILDAIDGETASGSGQSQIVEHGRQVGEELGNRPPNEVKATLVKLACRVAINFDRVEINISRNRLAAFLAGQSIDLAIQTQKPGRNSDDVVTLAAPARLKRIGREMRMLVENSNDQAAADPSLLRIIARAHDIQERLSQNPKLTVHDIARDERVSAAYLYTLLRLPWLAPTSRRLPVF
jgi:DNA invertase Pin-like site-specific DNA recombinase